MADSQEFVDETTPSSSGKGKKFVLLAIFGVMLVEGVGLFLLTKMMYDQPQSAQADVTEEQKILQGVQEETELKLAELSAFNKREGATVPV